MDDYEFRKECEKHFSGEHCNYQVKREYAICGGTVVLRDPSSSKCLEAAIEVLRKRTKTPRTKHSWNLLMRV